MRRPHLPPPCGEGLGVGVTHKLHRGVVGRLLPVSRATLRQLLPLLHPTPSPSPSREGDLVGAPGEVQCLSSEWADIRGNHELHRQAVSPSSGPAQELARASPGATTKAPCHAVRGLRARMIYHRWLIELASTTWTSPATPHRQGFRDRLLVEGADLIPFPAATASIRCTGACRRSPPAPISPTATSSTSACPATAIQPRSDLASSADAVRRRANMTYIVMNNGCYGLTKGQFPRPMTRLRLE